MRRLKTFVCVILSALLLLSVPAFAFQLPHAFPQDGATCIGTFEIAKWKDNPADQKGVYDFWMKFKSSSRSVILYRGIPGDKTIPERYTFICLPDDVIGTISQTSSSSIEFKATRSNGMLATVQWMEFKRSGDLLKYFDSNSFSASTFNGVVGGTYFSINPPQGLSQSVVAEFDGDALGFVDDLEDAPPPPDENGGILGWLDGFWDGLLKFFKNIFVPRDGYFDDWFSEIRSAFNAKLGGLDNVFNQISSAFDGLGGGSGASALKIVIPKNVFYPGFAGYEVDLVPYIQPYLNFIRPVFTGFFCVITAIYCYKHLVEITNT